MRVLGPPSVFRLASALLLGMALQAIARCGSSSNTGSQPIDVPDTITLTDTLRDADGLIVPDLGTSDMDGDGESDLDIGVDGDLLCAPGAAAFGCPCAGNGDCVSRYCGFHTGERVCALDCVDTCPAGFTCQPVNVGGADAIYVCISTFPHLCLPCAGDDDCRLVSGAFDLCLDYGEAAGSFCGGACASAFDCPAGYVCADATTASGESLQQCVPASGECSCSNTAITYVLSTPCALVNEYGTCQGTRVCKAEGLTSCSAAVPTEEVCFNEVDDDCDGQTDLDDTDCVIPCVCGDELCEPDRCGEYWDEEQKTCAADCAPCGNETCDPGEGPVKCPEDCCGGCGDGHCRGGACGEDPLECPQDCGHWACGDGDCDPGESSVECPVDCQPFACGNHTCEPMENPGSCQEDCGVACGDCACTPPESFVTCPVDCGFCGDGFCVKKCDYLTPENDETCPADCCLPDCFGKECGDDGCAGVCGLCPDDDICRSTCHVGTCGPAFEEEVACDGLDEDCDGETDEGFKWMEPGSDVEKVLGDDCGAGVCSGGGLLCAVDGGGLICSTEVEVGGERCDGVDNDCDGQTDAEDGADVEAGDPRPCEQQLGVCAGARKPARVCVTGEWLPCDEEVYIAHAQSYEPGEELSCDGLDNDCDGETDEDLSVSLSSGVTVWGVGTTCGVGMCAGGATECREDGLGVECPTEVFAQAERCDGKDNDCDGQKDEADGEPPLPPCTVGEACIEGACVVTCAPLGEDDTTCDGVDDDCDGETDDDWASEPTSCGEGACAASGETICEGSVEGDTCTAGTPAVNDTTCDGADDDCDGQSDEDYAPTPTECGEGACASTGDLVCQDGVEVDTCTPGTGAADDASCDGVDQDCDGKTDEDYVADESCYLPGACAAVNQASTCVNGVETPCQTGTPAADDADCDDVDDDSTRRRTGVCSALRSCSSARMTFAAVQPALRASTVRTAAHARRISAPRIPVRAQTYRAEARARTETYVRLTLALV